MSTPSAEDFRALARSSPERWSTLRFTTRWAGPWVPSAPVRAWLRRPDRLRVETLGGALVQVVRDGSVPATAVLVADGGVPEPAPQPAVTSSRADDPMFQSYSWVAMLDPVEMADGDPERDGPAVVVGDVWVVDHGGRPAWQAIVSTGPAYDPRCSCCPLLPSSDAADLEVFDEHPAGYEHGEAFLVRLDVGTGVCVLTEQVDGTDLGRGHDVRIEAVDEPMGDELFVERRGLFRRR